MMITDHIAAAIGISNNRMNKFRISVLVFTIIGAVIPDIPAYIFPPGTIGYFSHRAYTHSIILSFLYCLIPVGIYWLFRRNSKGKPWLLFYIFALTGYLSHLLFDLITTYGTKIFFPLSVRIYAWDFFHEFDPIFMAISFFLIILFIVFIRKKKPVPTKFVLIYAALLLVYFMVVLVQKKSFERQSKTHLAGISGDIRYLKTIPRTFWRWKGIAEDADSFYVIRKQEGTFELKKYSKEKTRNESIISDPYYKMFMNYARYPVQIIAGDTISLTNLIYSSDSYQVQFILNAQKQIIHKSVSGFDLLDKNL